MIRAAAPAVLAAAMTVALAGGVRADDFPDPPKPGDLLSAISGDWNGDGLPDAALLTQNGADAADLTVYLGQNVFGLKPEVTVKRAIFSGLMAGQTPWLEPLSKTAFRLHQEQIGIGREPWESVFSIAWRNNAFTVSGYTFQFYDRIDQSHTGRCDVNLLTGSYVLDIGQDRTQGQQDRRAFPLRDLKADWMPMICTGMFN